MIAKTEPSPFFIKELMYFGKKFNSFPLAISLIMGNAVGLIVMLFSYFKGKSKPMVVYELKAN